MTCIGEEYLSLSYNSAILDFMVNDEQDKRTEAPRVKMPQKPTEDILLNFLSTSELTVKTPTSVSFRSIEDPLPSYDDNFATLTDRNVNNEQRTVTNDTGPRQLTTLTWTNAPRAPLNLKTEKKPFSPSDVLNKLPIKKERTESDPILNFNSLKDCSPLKECGPVVREIKKEKQDIDQFFRDNNSMSISLDDVSSMMEEGPSFHDHLSPVSPASSEGSTDTLHSSGVSDVETSPKRGAASPLKKTRRRKVTEGGNCPHLWQFILELLGDKTHAQVISWTGVEFHFKVHNSRELARLWGARKNKPRMNFDKLSRAMRYYYDKNIIRHISGQRLVYEFCRNNDDTVYSKLLKDAARTMPQKPLVSLATAPAPAPKHRYSPPSYTSYEHVTTTPSANKCNYSTPQNYRTEAAPAAAPQSFPSYAAVYHPSLYNSTEQYVEQHLGNHGNQAGNRGNTTQQQQQQQQQQQEMIPPPYIPNYSYNQSNININVQVGGAGNYSKERLGYSYASHYTPY